MGGCSGGRAPGKQGLAVGGELLAHDAVKGLEPYAAVGVAHGPVGGEAHKVGVRHVDRRLEILLASSSKPELQLEDDAQRELGQDCS